MKIPDNVVLFCREYERVELMNGQMKKVMPTYPAHEYSKARMEGGLRWANTSYGGDYRKVGLFRKVETENKFRGLYLHRLEIRGEGGRAYKVAVAGEYYVDLREDQLLDIMQFAGIEKGGYINDDFCFATIGSDFRIIRIGSDEYNKLKEIDGMEKPSVKNLQFGSICSGGTNSTFIYLGMVKSNDWQGVVTGGRNSSIYSSWQRRTSAYLSVKTPQPQLPPLVYTYTKIGEDQYTLLWFEPYNPDSTDYDNLDVLSDTFSAYRLTYPKSSKRAYSGKEAKFYADGIPITNTKEFIEAWGKRPQHTRDSGYGYGQEYADTLDYRIRMAEAIDKIPPKPKKAK